MEQSYYIPPIFNMPDSYKQDKLNQIEVELENSDTGVALDLTGSVAWLQLRDKDNRVVFEFKSGILPVGNQALLTITLPNKVTFPVIGSLNIIAGDYNQDFQIQFANGSVKTFWRGKWKIIQDITHA